MKGNTRFPNPADYRSGLPVQVTGASDGYEGVRIIRPNGHDQHQLALCISGSGFFSCKGETRRVEAGQLFFFRLGVPHAYEPAEPAWMLKWVTFTGEGSGAVLDYLRYPEQDVFKAEAGEIGLLFDRIVDMLGHGDPFRATLLLQELLLIAALERERVHDDARRRLDKVVLHIHAHYGGCLAIRDLATVYGSSVSYLCRTFREAFGTTPMDFLNRHRISMAKSMLVDSAHSISEIASLCGFSHPDYFSTVFRKHVGTPPKAFRASFGLQPVPE